MKRWFFQRKVKPNYDVSLEEPVLSVSICTGEIVGDIRRVY